MKKEQFNTPWDSEYWMESNGFFCGFNMPDALKGDHVHGLPPYNWRSSYLVDEYPASDKDWMPSEGRLTSYFVPIQNANGMWLDFNKNNDKKHHLAIVVSIQGVNAITGLPCNDAQLEQYTDICPTHEKPFGPNRLCEDCGYKWPKQNYLCTTGTPTGSLWLDGFRAANGAVQQYILTEKTMKGVASNILGKDRVFAIGVSFFLSKHPKPVSEQPYVTRIAQAKVWDGKLYSTKISSLGGGTSSPISSPNSYDGDPVTYTTSNINVIEPDNSFARYAKYEKDTRNIAKTIDRKGAVPDSMEVMDFMPVAGAIAGAIAGADAACSDEDDSDSLYHMRTDGEVKEITELQLGEESQGCITDSQFDMSSYTPIRTKNMEIGKGASIAQDVYEDPEPLDYWRDKPEAILCINYCLEDECIKIIKQGKVSKEGHKQGFLKDIPVAN